jgi:hypothetical protein
MLGRGWFLVPIAVIGLIVAGTIAAVAWHHGDDDRGPRVVQVTTPSGDPSGGTTQVIEVRDGWRGHGGFFPGFFVFPLLFFLLIFWCIGGFFRRGGPGGPWRDHWDDRFEAWHREQHKGEAPPPSAPAASA